MVLAQPVEVWMTRQKRGWDEEDRPQFFLGSVERRIVEDRRADPRTAIAATTPRPKWT